VRPHNSLSQVKFYWIPLAHLTILIFLSSNNLNSCKLDLITQRIICDGELKLATSFAFFYMRRCLFHVYLRLNCVYLSQYTHLAFDSVLSSESDIRLERHSILSRQMGAGFTAPIWRKSTQLALNLLLSPRNSDRFSLCPQTSSTTLQKP
jgi:hypothetical protein